MTHPPDIHLTSADTERLPIAARKAHRHGSTLRNRFRLSSGAPPLQVPRRAPRWQVPRRCPLVLGPLWASRGLSGPLCWKSFEILSQFMARGTVRKKLPEKKNNQPHRSQKSGSRKCTGNIDSVFDFVFFPFVPLLRPPASGRTRDGREARTKQDSKPHGWMARVSEARRQTTHPNAARTEENKDTREHQQNKSERGANRRVADTGQNVTNIVSVTCQCVSLFSCADSGTSPNTCFSIYSMSESTATGGRKEIKKGRGFIPCATRRLLSFSACPSLLL